MYGFPHRPGPRYAYMARRSWNNEVPYFEELQAWFRAEDSCFSDVSRTVPCSPGDDINSYADLSQYAHHAAPVSTRRMKFVTDSGFPAIQTVATGTLGELIVRTAASFASAFQIVVFRAADVVWGYYGCVFGRLGSPRPYLFHREGAIWNDAPVSVQKQNGVSQTVGAVLSSINRPMVASFGVPPGASSQWEIGSQTDGGVYMNQLYIYEILAYSAILATDQIIEVEAYLMDKYGISA